MKPDAAKEEFEQFVLQAGANVSDLTPERAVKLMCDFYRTKPASGCQEDDGDTLACRWTTEDSGHGRCFQWEIKRRFIEGSDEDEDGMTELNLTCYFPTSRSLEALLQEEFECLSPADVGQFERAVVTSPGFQAVATKEPAVVSLQYINI